jgi:hypothetical protein
LMGGYLDHRFIGFLLGQAAGVNAIALHEDHSCLKPSPFVAVEVRLALSDMVCVGGGNLVNVAAAVVITSGAAAMADSRAFSSRTPCTPP